MAVLRVAEALLNPGRGPQWRQAAKETQTLIESEGGTLRFYQLLAGGDPMTTSGVSFFPDLDSYSAFVDKMNASSKLPELMQKQSQSDGFPFSTPISINVYQDIHAEVGDPTEPVDNPQIISLFRQKLAPGKRPDFITMAKGIRATLKEEGRRVGNSMQAVTGEAGTVMRSLGFASMADWSTNENLGFPNKVMDIIATANAQGPLFTDTQHQLLRDITASL